jgi:RNase P subunit RPR2
MKIKTNKILGLGAVLLAIAALAGCASPGGKSTVRVREEKHYIRLQHVEDTGQPVNLKKGDAVAMACAKCKTVMYHPITASTTWFYQPFLGRSGPGLPGYSYSAWQQQHTTSQNWSQRHYCPGCKSTITTTGTWLNAKETVKHTCDACGDDSVFCCATRREAPPTEGMTPQK